MPDNKCPWCGAEWKESRYECGSSHGAAQADTCKLIVATRRIAELEAEVRSLLPSSHFKCKSCGGMRTSELCIGCLRQEQADVRKVLEPFAHPALCQALGGNIEGDASIVFQRNDAVLTLGDFRLAHQQKGTTDE